VSRPREYPDDLRQRLLEAAAHVLATEGVGALSTRRVSAEVGTSTNAIYRLWGSMPELIRALYLEGFRRLGLHLARVATTDDPVGDVRRLGDAYHASAVENPEFYGVMFGAAVPGFSADPDDAAFALSTLVVLIDAVRRAVEAGALHGHPEDLARELWSVNHGITSLGLAGMLGPPESVAAHLDRVMAASLAGYAERVPASASTPGPDRSA
jgi:AcrR family transcriptional regulator